MGPHQHIGNPTGPPYPAHSNHPASSAYDFSSSSVDIQGVRRSAESARLSNTWVTPKAGSSKGPMIRHIAPQSPPNQQPVLGKKWRRTTVETLPEDTLLEIFDFYRLGATKLERGPWNWLRLAHVCKRWRYIISMSPRRLDMRILCTSGAAIESTLDSWPTLPLVIAYDSSRRSKPMPRNVIVALRHPSRLCKIDLRVSSSRTGSIVEAIQKPCPALESIRVRVEYGTRLPILVRNVFLGGSAPYLREIELDGIAVPFPEMRQVLLSTNNLTKLHLSRIPNDVYFSPEDLVTILSTLVQLKGLTVGFYSPASRPHSSMTYSPQRTILPTLRFIDFRGATDYVEEFLSRIDPLALHNITISLFNEIFFEVPQFCEFMTRQITQGSPTAASISFFLDFVCIDLFRGNGHVNGKEYCTLRNLCKPHDWQLSFVAQISSQLSPLLSSVQELTISSLELPTGEAVDSALWLELFQPFTHVTKVTVWQEKHLPDMLQALMEDVAAGVTVLPELTTLCLYEYRSTPSVAKAAEQFVATRRLSGRTVNLIG